MTSRNKLIKIVFILAGSICVALGSLGIFIPVFPTTPFLLLAAGCYIKASQRYYKWLINHRLFGAFIKGYIEGSGVPLRSKIFAIAFLWAGILISIFMLKALWARILLICIAFAVTAHISLIKPKLKAHQQTDK